VERVDLQLFINGEWPLCESRETFECKAVVAKKHIEGSQSGGDD
jgi:hypothetical protein